MWWVTSGVGSSAPADISKPSTRSTWPITLAWPARSVSALDPDEAHVHLARARRTRPTLRPHRARCARVDRQSQRARIARPRRSHDVDAAAAGRAAGERRARSSRSGGAGRAPNASRDRKALWNRVDREHVASRRPRAPPAPRTARPARARARRRLSPARRLARRPPRDSRCPSRRRRTVRRRPMPSGTRRSTRSACGTSTSSACVPGQVAERRAVAEGARLRAAVDTIQRRQKKQTPHAV